LKKEFKGATAAAEQVEISGAVGQILPAEQKITVTLAKPTDAGAEAEDPKFKAVDATEATSWINELPDGITATAAAIAENTNSVEFTLAGTPTTKTDNVAITIPAKWIVGQEDTSETITADTSKVTFNIGDGEIAATEITALPGTADMKAGTLFTALEAKITAKTGDDVHYTKGDITWWYKDTGVSGDYVEATGTALEGGKSYRVRIALNADTDWVFGYNAKTVTLPDGKTEPGELAVGDKTLFVAVDLGAVEAGNPGDTETPITGEKNDLFTVNIATAPANDGEVTGITAADGKGFTLDIPGSAKWVTKAGAATDVVEATISCTAKDTYKFTTGTSL